MREEQPPKLCPLPHRILNYYDQFNNLDNITIVSNHRHYPIEDIDNVSMATSVLFHTIALETIPIFHI